MLPIQCAGEEIHLLPQRAILWPRASALIVADLHLGKAATFRNAGIPVPEETTRHTLDQLDSAIAATSPRRLVILGDLLHAPEGRSPGTLAAVAAWRAAYPRLAIQLIRGNHDRSAGEPPRDWHIESLDAPFPDPPFTLCHEPLDSPPSPNPPYSLCGHLHPAAVVNDHAGHSLRAPCFWFSPTRAVLPAFGSFTGARRIRPGPDDRIFLVGPGQVVPAPTERARIR